MTMYARIRRLPSGKGRGRRRVAFTTEKMAALPPMATASVSTAVSVKAGRRRRTRAA
jgi:hypothetical protein